MLDLLFSFGQAMSVLLILYGGYLMLNPQLEDELQLLKHIRNDA